jgi:hypothetical protein
VPVLLLARGDAQAKDLLRRAIEARYGFSPPAIDSLEIDFTGRVRTKVGPITTWVPVGIMARFRFPTAMRWDFSVRPVGVTVQRGIEAFDGATFRHVRGGSAPSIIDNIALISSLQRRLWAMAAVLLTPLGEHFVELKAVNGSGLEATNTLIKDCVTLHLRADSTLERVDVKCVNPDSDKEQLFSLRLSESQAPVNDMMLPRKISAFWDDAPYFEVEPKRIENNPTFSDGIFSLENEDQ